MLLRAEPCFQSRVQLSLILVVARQGDHEAGGPASADCPGILPLAIPGLEARWAAARSCQNRVPLAPARPWRAPGFRRADAKDAWDCFGCWPAPEGAIGSG